MSALSEKVSGSLKMAREHKMRPNCLLDAGFAEDRGRVLGGGLSSISLIPNISFTMSRDFQILWSWNAADVLSRHYWHRGLRDKESRDILAWWLIEILRAPVWMPKAGKGRRRRGFLDSEVLGYGYDKYSACFVRSSTSRPPAT